MNKDKYLISKLR